MKFNIQNLKISKKTTIFIIAVVFLVSADRFLKALCLKGFYDQPVPVLGDIFSLHFVKNNYIAFSLPLSGPILTGVIGLIILVLLILLIKSFFTSNSQIFQFSNFQSALTALIIGAIVNFTDRIEYGYVIDYFDLKYFTIFNLPDIMISVSVLLLVLNNLKGNEKT